MGVVDEWEWENRCGCDHKDDEIERLQGLIDAWAHSDPFGDNHEAALVALLAAATPKENTP